MSMPSTSGSNIARAFGPCTAITAHCSVIDVSQTFEIGPFGLQIILHHARARARAPPVVVVTWKRSLASARDDAVVAR